MKSWDAIIIGGGIIGLSVAISLRKNGLRVLVVERGEPGREASHAAAGMLVGVGAEIPSALKALAAESARMYPEFVHEVEDESGINVDLCEHGSILISSSHDFPESAQRLSAEQLEALQPAVRRPSLEAGGELFAAYLPESAVDPRKLVNAVLEAARHRGVDISSGSAVHELQLASGRVAGVKTTRTSYASEVVVNCGGAWAGQVGPNRFPVRPVKGQMLAVVGGPPLKHVVRGDDVYLVPRSDGRIVIGSTLEEAGFDKRTDVATIERMFHAATELVPALAKARQHEDWAGLRPATPDNLPILGETSTPGYFIAGGHYRDGILLAPVTARLMTEVIAGKPADRDLAAFSPARFI